MSSLKRKRSNDDQSRQMLKQVRQDLGADSEDEDKNYRVIPESTKSLPDIEEILRELEEEPSVKGGTELLMSYDEFKTKSLTSNEKLELVTHHSPDSVEDFKRRLSTYDIRRWTGKPDCIASFHCARFGWQLLENANALICVKCKNRIPISPTAYGLTSTEYGVQLRKAIESSCHALTCPWKKYYSPVTILCLPKGFHMYHYLRVAVESFKPPFSLPALTSHYRQLMMDLNLFWMNDIMGKGDEGTIDNCHDFDRAQMTKFLVLNGWSMIAATIKDGIRCQMCLREVPLWLYKPFSAMNDSFELLSPPDSPAKSVSCKDSEFDPVNNHWWWCPWRKYVQFSEAAEMNNFASNLTDSKFFEMRYEVSTYLKPKAEASDYLRLKELMEGECAQACSINQQKDFVSSVVSTVETIMDEFVSPPRGSSFSPAVIATNFRGAVVNIPLLCLDDSVCSNEEGDAATVDCAANASKDDHRDQGAENNNQSDHDHREGDDNNSQDEDASRQAAANKHEDKVRDSTANKIQGEEASSEDAENNDKDEVKKVAANRSQDVDASSQAAATIDCAANAAKDDDRDQGAENNNQGDNREGADNNCQDEDASSRAIANKFEGKVRESAANEIQDEEAGGEATAYKPEDEVEEVSANRNQDVDATSQVAVATNKQEEVREDVADKNESPSPEIAAHTSDESEVK